MSCSASLDSGDSLRRISIRQSRATSATATATVADEALRQVLDRRLRKREGRPPAAATREFGSDRPADETATDRPASRRWVIGLASAVLVVGLAYSVVTFRGPRLPAAVHPVSASVTVGRAVPVGARVVLHPRSAPLPGDAMPQGTVGEDGTVTFVTYPPLPGVPAGDYVATLQWFRVGADGSVSGNVVPARYASVASSPLTIKVTGDDANRHVLKVQAK